MSDHLIIFDTTLRDGEQSPGASMTKEEKINAVFEALVRKDDFRRVADKMLKQTPEYAQARTEGRARAWLAEEGGSAAEMLYAAMLARMEDLEP